MKVMVSSRTYSRGEYVVLCEQEFDELEWAELIFEDDAGERIRKFGETGPTRPGRRAEDRVREPPIHVVRFYPGGRR